MHVAEFFCSLLRVSDIEVVVASLPELRLAGSLQQLGRALLQYLKSGGEREDFWFSYEQMDVLRHEDVSGDYKLILFADSLEFVFEDGVSAGARQQWEPMTTTEGDEVETAGSLNTNQT